MLADWKPAAELPLGTVSWRFSSQNGTVEAESLKYKIFDELATFRIRFPPGSVNGVTRPRNVRHQRRKFNMSSSPEHCHESLTAYVQCCVHFSPSFRRMDYFLD